MADNKGCEREGKVVCQSGSSVSVLFVGSGRIIAAEFTKQKKVFSSAGTVLMPLSQSGPVAKCAMNLPPLCQREGHTHTHRHTHTHTHVIDSKSMLRKCFS